MRIVQRLEQPFSWLGDVWTRGRTTIMGRFTLSATGGGQWTLRTAGPDEAPEDHHHPNGLTTE